MEVTLNGSRPSMRGPADYFTGDVRVDPLVQAPDPARVTAASVTNDRLRLRRRFRSASFTQAFNSSFPPRRPGAHLCPPVRHRR